MRADRRIDAISSVVGEDNLSTVAANQLAEALLGNTIYANVLMPGFAWQKGLVPLSETALERAIQLKNVAIEHNIAAFNWGRLAAADSDFVAQYLRAPETRVTKLETLDTIIDYRANFLSDYQNTQLADRFRALVTRVRTTEEALDASTQHPLTKTVAKAWFKTLAYKDEYEVARLHVHGDFLANIKREYGSKARVRFHLAPPLLNAELDARGRPRKREFGAWIIPIFRVLASMRTLRGTKLDVFGMTKERKMERALIAEFEDQLEQVLPKLDAGNIDSAVKIFNEYLEIRGYGPVKIAAAAATRERIQARLAVLLQGSRKAA